MYLKVQTNKLHTTTKEASNEFKLNKIYKCHTLGPLAPSFAFRETIYLSDSISLTQITPSTQKLYIAYRACPTLAKRNNMIKL